MGVPPGFGNARPESPVQQQAPQHGGSFLGTAAAAAAGVIGGSLLLDSIRSITGGSRQALADSSSDSASPWGSDKASSSDLARDAGVSDVGRNAERADAQDDQQQAFDSAEANFDDEDVDMDYDIGDSDFG